MITCIFDHGMKGLCLSFNLVYYIQNKIIRFVLKMDPQSNLGQDISKAVGWLPASKRVDQIILNHVLR